jgi:caffeoyl-CoA O-methyltransferase
MIEFPEGIEEYALKHSDREASILYDLTQEANSEIHGPVKISGHFVGTLLRTLVQISGAKNVLEIGTFAGYSTLSIAMGLPVDGKIITLDNDEEITSVAQRFWDQTHLGKKIELKLGPVMESLESLKGPFDMVFIGGNKHEYIPYWDKSVDLVKAGGLVIVDNVLLSGSVVKPHDEMSEAVDAFNEYVRYDQRVQRLMLTIRDGITIARKF